MPRPCGPCRCFRRFGVRFPCMSDAYDQDLLRLAQQTAEKQNCSSFLQQGVYCMVGGPTYETVAESRLLKTLGADAVGESDPVTWDVMTRLPTMHHFKSTYRFILRIKLSGFSHSSVPVCFFCVTPPSRDEHGARGGGGPSLQPPRSWPVPHHQQGGE